MSRARCGTAYQSKRSSSMRYFLHLQDRRPVTEAKGVDCASDMAAMAQAALVAQQLARNNLDAAVWTLAVIDSGGREVGKIDLASGDVLGEGRQISVGQ
jgi:hypothetical protein